jgi:DUF4097 and DUF4098 domain-containing protein YvlB
MRRETFETPGPVTLNLKIPSGHIDLLAVEGQETLVELDSDAELEEQVRIEMHPRRDGHEVVVSLDERLGLGLFRRGRSDIRLRVTAPLNADVEVSTASADTDARGRFGGLHANTASGDVRFEHLGGEVQVNSASGDLEIQHVGGQLTVNTASGDVEVGQIIGEGKVRAASGDISIKEAESALTVQTASGDIDVRSVREGDVKVQTASGDIEVGVARGSKVFIDARSMSGETSSDLEITDVPSEVEGPEVEISATAMSGDITISRAA